MYWSRVFSETAAPAGHAVLVSSRRRTTDIRRGQQLGQQAELGRRQGDPRLAARQRVRRRVEHEVAPGADRIHAAPEQGPQSSQQFREGERFGQVVVTARGEAGQPVGEVAARGEEQHRRVQALRAQGGAHVAAVPVGQADVEDERVDRRPGLRSLRVTPTRRPRR